MCVIREPVTTYIGSETVPISEYMAVTSNLNRIVSVTKIMPASVSVETESPAVDIIKTHECAKVSLAHGKKREAELANQRQ